MMTRSLAPRCCVLLFHCWRSLKCTMMRSLTLRHHTFFCSNDVGHNDEEFNSLSCFFGSNVKGPHGHDDEELNSTSSCSFVLVLQVNQVHETRSSTFHCHVFLFQCYKFWDTMMRSLAPHCHIFFIQVLQVPMATTRRSSTPCHCVVLFQCCRLIKCTMMRSPTPHCHVFFLVSML